MTRLVVMMLWRAVFIGGSPHAVSDLWDVAAHHGNLRFTCRRCSHSAVIHAAALWQAFRRKHWNDYLAAVPPRMRCIECWRVAGDLVRGPEMAIVDDEPTLRMPMPDDLAWKRMARRRR